MILPPSSGHTIGDIHPVGHLKGIPGEAIDVSVLAFRIEVYLGAIEKLSRICAQFTLGGPDLQAVVAVALGEPPVYPARLDTASRPSVADSKTYDQGLVTVALRALAVGRRLAHGNASRRYWMRLSPVPS